jgi:hypothetical protein
MLHPGRISLLAAALLVTISTSPASTAGQGVADAPPAKGKRWTWPKNARVVVNISPEFSIFGARPAIESAFRRWEAEGRAGGNGSGVAFRFTYNQNPVPGLWTFVVSQGTVRTGGQARTTISSAESGVFAAWCVVDARVTDPTAVAHVMAHEIGHTFGLAECDSCEPGTSVMTRFSGDFNDVVSGRAGPSEADNAAVRANGAY